MKQILHIFLFLVFVIPFKSNAEVTSKPCPYSCETEGYPKSRCKDYRKGNRCFVEYNERVAKTSVLCMKTADGSLRVSTTCKSDGSEQKVDYSMLVGATGPQGPKGEAGTDGAIRIYGDGSAGSKTFTASTIFQDANPQYTDITINPGVILTVPSGTTLRCSGNFLNQGTIIVQNGLRDAPHFADNGRILASASSSGFESAGGPGGSALPVALVRQLLRLQLLSAGNGYRESTDTGSDGGGNFTIFCKNAITNEGTIRANGTSAAFQYRGGGAGGFIILASGGSVIHSGTIEAKGGNGGEVQADDGNSTGRGPGGGGGGGIVHLIAPTLITTGTVTVTGGQGGSAGSPGSITAFLYFGGGGGGASGGAGGQGGTVNLGNIGNNSTTPANNGETGQVIQTQADPASLY